jgi:FixJ family two-component response regulator
MKPDGISIAIVDDDESIRVSLLRLCRVYGLTANAYASGPEFIASLDAGASPVDCLLVDAHMPKMTGAELIHLLNVRSVSIPTIILTADDEPAVRAQYSSKSVVAYLNKPLTAEKLLAAIKEAVQQR